MKKLLLLLFSLLAGAVIFVWVLRTVGWQEIKNALLVFSGWKGLVILLITFLMAVIGTWKWKAILDGKGQRVSFGELWRYYLATFSIRLFVPIAIVGAEIFQGYILKKKNSIPWDQGMASVIIDRILEWTANLVVIFLGAVFFLLMIGVPPINLVIIFGSIFLVLAAAISFFYFKAFKRQSMAKFFCKFFNNSLDSQLFNIEKEIFVFFKLKKKNMWKVFGLNFLRASFMLLRTWILIIFLGGKISILSALSVLGFTYLAVAIPIPTALGSHEAIQLFAFNYLHLKTATATAFTMIIRGAEVMVALVGVIILFRLGAFLIKETIFKRFNSFSNNNDRN